MLYGFVSRDVFNFFLVPSLSSKLSSQAKYFIEETPEKSSSPRVSHGATRGNTVDLASSPIKVVICHCCCLFYLCEQEKSYSILVQ